MREIDIPPMVTPDPGSDLTDIVADLAREKPDLVVYGRRAGDLWQDVTASAFLAEVTSVAKGLVAAGIGPGDRVGLMSRTRYEWTLCDFAIWFAGGVTVPIYETSSAEQVRWILADSGAVAVLTETPAHTRTVSEVRGDLAALRSVWTFDNGDLKDLVAGGKDISDEEITSRRATLASDSLATIIYTSGTTGRPKGCELTHGNFKFLAENAVAGWKDVVRDGSSTLLFLPLAHVFARFIQVLALAGQAKLSHTPDVSALLDDLAQVKPTFLLAVPRVFEKIYNSAEAKAVAGGKGGVFAKAAATAVAYSESLDDGGPGLKLRLQHAVFDKLVYGKLRTATGGQVEYAISGGAPLGARLGHFFRGVGITILEGYGLTETTAPATVNTPDHVRIGTVGRPLPGVAVKVADDGELLIKGINVMLGYFGNDAATGEALEEGWFHTGDLGEIDEEGVVRITGRKKEILVTAGGKNVAPAVLEDRLRAHPLVSQCMVVGDQKPYIACLVTLDAEMLPIWLTNHGKAAMEVGAAAKDPDVTAEIQRAVDEANKAVSKAESIRRFEILDVDFTEAGGQLTPKQSLKRPVVMKEFADQVEQLYR